MPVTNSVAFANNRGGSGKTFLVFQLACEAARARPSSKVLVIDFSLYSETSGLLMGGLARADPLAPTKGLVTTVEHTTADTRTEGLVRALVLAAGAGPHDSIFGKWFAPKPTSAVDLLKYAVQPSKYNPRIPSNLYLVASAGKNSWGENTNSNTSDGTAEVPMWARQHSTEWWPAAQQLKQAFARLNGEWNVFADTDHLAASPLTKLAFGAMERIVVPLSLDQGDFSRLFHDPTGNALFTDVLMPMAQNPEISSARVSKFIFTKVLPKANTEITTHAGIKSPFTPPVLAQQEMANLADSLRNVSKDNTLMQSTLYDFTANSEVDDGARLQMFCRKYCTAFKLVADGPANVSKTSGVPLCTMESNEAKLGKDTLDALKAEVNFAVLQILGEDYQDSFQGFQTPTADPTSGPTPTPTFGSAA
eukprot:CAMPEP_0198203940 /NCGR_PEP_ID=MMETSP1445-20131203/7278_1 /TAXON_ID=36898 /ORGANISM="Pyramimonas sp., Strain CCMP2087" /LENGTH=419 /DNA_ID=CAMNT_0043875547 /DNA_START=207 /DNA_END=1466 /DNA_ORIENTATION=-